MGAIKSSNETKRGKGNRGRWLPIDVLFSSTSLFRGVSKRLLSKIQTKPGTHRGKGGDGDSNIREDNHDPLNRVRIFRHLPLFQACVAIGIYLSIGVLSFKGIFPEASWSFLDALYFSCVCLSTIGYGDLVPSTNGGKIFAALFGMSGLLLWSSFIATVGTRLVQSETTEADANLRTQRKNAVLEFYEEHMPEQLKFKQQAGEEKAKEDEESAISSSVNGKSAWPLAAPYSTRQQRKRQDEGSQWMLLARSLAKPFVVIVSGGTFIGRLEGWNLCDSFYYSLITATTIGFGDYSPTTRAGRIMAIALIPVLLAAAGDFFARVGIFVMRKRTQQLFASQAERAEWLTQERVTEMDLDGDGRVSKAEYVLYMLIETGIVDKDESLLLEEQFERFDVTRSGFIESADLRAMRKLREKLQSQRNDHKGKGQNGKTKRNNNNN
jgi:potassium channel subfamily K